MSISNIINSNIYLSSPIAFNDPFDSYILKDDESYVKYLLLEKIKEKEFVSALESDNHFSIKEFKTLKYSPIQGKYEPALGHNTSFSTILYKLLETKSKSFWMDINSYNVASKRIADKKTKEVRKTPFKVACLSNFKDEKELGLNTTMWSHYASSHTGFCIKYNLNFDTVLNEELIKFGLFPVLYSSRVPKLTLKDYKLLNCNSNLLDWPPSVIKKMFKMLLTKSRFWSYEKEWRLLISNEYETLFSDSTLPFFEIDSIYLGCRANPSLTKMLVNLGIMNNFKVFKSEQSNKSITLEFNEIDKKELLDEEYYSKLYHINRITNEVERSRKSKLLEIFYKNHIV